MFQVTNGNAERRSPRPNYSTSGGPAGAAGADYLGPAPVVYPPPSTNYATAVSSSYLPAPPATYHPPLYAPYLPHPNPVRENRL